jgi:hypothetical protein
MFGNKDSVEYIEPIRYFIEGYAVRIETLSGSRHYNVTKHQANRLKKKMHNPNLKTKYVEFNYIDSVDPTVLIRRSTIKYINITPSRFEVSEQVFHQISKGKVLK